MAERGKVSSGASWRPVLVLFGLLVPAALCVVSQRLELAALRQALDGQQGDEMNQLVQARRAVSLLSSEVASKAAAASRVARTAVAAPTPGEPPYLTYARRLADPQYHELTRIALRQSVIPRYAALVRSSGLPAAERERLMDLIADRELARKDATFVAIQKGIWSGDNPALYHQVVDASLAPVDEEIASVAGTAGLDAVKQVSDNERGQSTVDALAGPMSLAGTPFTDQQSLQLAKLLQGQPARELLPSVLFDDDGETHVDVPYESTISDDVVKAASSFLSADQIAVLKARQQFQQQVAAVRATVPGG